MTKEEWEIRQAECTQVCVNLTVFGNHSPQPIDWNGKKILFLGHWSEHDQDTSQVWGHNLNTAYSVQIEPYSISSQYSPYNLFDLSSLDTCANAYKNDKCDIVIILGHGSRDNGGHIIFSKNGDRIGPTWAKVNGAVSTDGKAFEQYAALMKKIVKENGMLLYCCCYLASTSFLKEVYLKLGCKVSVFGFTSHIWMGVRAPLIGRGKNRHLDLTRGEVVVRYDDGSGKQTRSPVRLRLPTIDAFEWIQYCPSECVGIGDKPEGGQGDKPEEKLTRNYEVRFVKIEVQDDQDPVGKGEWKVYGKVNGEQVGTFEKKVTTGEIVDLPDTWVKTIPGNTVSQIEVEFGGEEDDAFVNDELGTARGIFGESEKELTETLESPNGSYKLIVKISPQK